MFTQTTWQIAGGYTQTTFVDALKAALEPVLGAVVDDYTASGTRSLVFKPLDTENADYNRVFFRIAVTSSYGVSVTVADAWNASTHVGTRESNVAPSLGTFSSTSSAVNMALFRSSEGVILCAQQGTAKGMGGALRLLDTPSWWNTANFNPWLAASNTTVYFPSGSGNPFNQTNSTYIYGTFDNVGTITNENPLTNRRALLAGGIGCYSTYACFGRLTDDLGYAAAAGTNIFDTFSTDDSPVQTWVSLDGDTNRALVGRTA